jgi:hypothetical protein
MNRAQRQVVAEKIGSPIRALELLGLEYEVTPPKNAKEAGNRSPRVVHVRVGHGKPLRVYNGVTGSTWANTGDGKPIAEIKTIETLFSYLEAQKAATDAKLKYR